ncbi:FxsA family protein [Aureimonas mangrovi]|uniref:FxsA family protein n=1 Tax=Aureimonas mangrovi TaxID=2758041 RepID=UPI00163D53D0|nr:FxsA family protein [Aureimonas mangrovi]
MPLLLALLSLLALPLAEIAVFIAVGSEIGVGWTLLLIVASMLVGILLVRRQSFSTLQAARAQARAGNVPAREMAHGAMIVFAGILLILPGFITDVLGLLLMVPPIRDLVWGWLSRRVVVTSVRGGPATASRGSPRGPSRGGVVDLDEGEFTRRPDLDGGEPDPDSPWRDEPRTIGDDTPREGR